MATSHTIAKELREVRREMKAMGIRRTSCFNGGLDRETYRYNARCFALETDLKTAKQNEAVTVET